jgi:hypothetical protein
MLVIPAFGRLRQEDCEFEVSLSYITRHCLKKKKNLSEKKFQNIPKGKTLPCTQRYTESMRFELVCGHLL